MPWRRFIQQLMNQEKVIRTLEDSAPIRKAAKYTVYLIQKGKQMAHDNIEKMKDSEILKNAEEAGSRQKSSYDSFKDRFANEVQKGFRELEKQNRTKKR